jgi:peroxiredoxin
MRKSLGVQWLVVALGTLGAASAAAGEPRVGRIIDEFALRDFRGKQHALSELADSRLVVVAFLGVDCPLAKLYAPRLETLRQEFAARGVAFLAIDSNSQDSLAEMAAFARASELTIPLLKDGGNQVADAFGAERTPEAFVLDSQRAVRYRGRIDDQYGLGTSSGYARPKIGRRDLAVALDELLAGKEVSRAEVDATGCLIGRVPKVTPQGSVTYCDQVARILQQRCVSCHRPGEIAPFPLQDYEEVVGWADTMREVLSEKRMPPWFASPDHGRFINDNQMSEDERQLIYAWIDDGCPLGDRSKLPAPRQFAVGWQIPRPDQIVYMTPEPVDVPADGTVDYRYYTVDPGWTEDKWIRAVEARPDNRAVVHHIILFFKPPGDSSTNGTRGNLGGYAPGGGTRVYPDGVAVMVPAGSQLVFQLHYTPNGSPQKDRSYAGFVFADPASVKLRAHTGAASNASFVIPAGADDHEVRAEYRFDQDMRLLTLAPHMHLRGKSFRYEAEFPDGAREVLLDVPRYDFNWQLKYVLAEPRHLPKGTVLHCTARFDNSEANLANPDPSDTVRFGPQTWHEMMIGWFGVMEERQGTSAESSLPTGGE